MSTAKDRWSKLDGKRVSFLNRCEKYAAFTSHKVCLPDGYDQYDNSVGHGWQALGTQALNNLTNKLMMVLFSPTRPFFRLEASDEIKNYFKQAGASEEKLKEALSLAEHSATEIIAKESLRPKLTEVIKHLIVTGNVLMILEEDKMRVVGIKNYVCKRDIYGNLVELILRDKLSFNQLKEDVQQEILKTNSYDDEEDVELFKWINLNENGDYVIDTWVNEIKLSEEYSSKQNKRDMEYLALTWDLSDNNDYGTGYVEDYESDFYALEALSKSKVEGGILASEYRWMVNPQGLTKPDDLQTSENGGVLSGSDSDVSVITAGAISGLDIVFKMVSEYTERISRGFLLQTNLVRNAERVTATEIRMQAQELETSLGGAYSRLAVDLQIPFSRYLLNKDSFKFNGKSIEPIIVTGVNALSRSFDANNLKMWLADVIEVNNLPPIFKKEAIAAGLASSYGIEANNYLMSKEAIAEARQAEARKQRAEMDKIDAENTKAQIEAVNAGANSEQT